MPHEWKNVPAERDGRGHEISDTGPQIRQTDEQRQPAAFQSEPRQRERRDLDGDRRGDEFVNELPRGVAAPFESADEPVTQHQSGRDDDERQREYYVLPRTPSHRASILALRRFSINDDAGNGGGDVAREQAADHGAQAELGKVGAATGR